MICKTPELESWISRVPGDWDSSWRDEKRKKKTTSSPEKCSNQEKEGNGQVNWDTSGGKSTRRETNAPGNKGKKKKVPTRHINPGGGERIVVIGPRARSEGHATWKT